MAGRRLDGRLAERAGQRGTRAGRGARLRGARLRNHLGVGAVDEVAYKRKPRAARHKLMLNRSMCTRTNEASSASIAARSSSRMRPHSMVASLQPDTSRRTTIPAAASAAAHGACTKGPRSVHLSTPSNTSKSTPTVRPLEALHVAMCSVPSTVSVILPWTKRSGTGRNCALIERRGAETRLKLRQGSPRTCAEERRRWLVWAARRTGIASAPTNVLGSSPALTGDRTAAAARAAAATVVPGVPIDPRCSGCKARSRPWCRVPPEHPGTCSCRWPRRRSRRSSRRWRRRHPPPQCHPGWTARSRPCPRAPPRHKVPPRTHTADAGRLRVDGRKGGGCRVEHAHVAHGAWRKVDVGPDRRRPAVLLDTAHARGGRSNRGEGGGGDIEDADVILVVRPKVDLAPDRRRAIVLEATVDPGGGHVDGGEDGRDGIDEADIILVARCKVDDSPNRRRASVLAVPAHAGGGRADFGKRGCGGVEHPDVIFPERREVDLVPDRRRASVLVVAGDPEGCHVDGREDGGCHSEHPNVILVVWSEVDAAPDRRRANVHVVRARPGSRRVDGREGPARGCSAHRQHPAQQEFTAARRAAAPLPRGRPRAGQPEQ
eukprot:scaffold2557_cov55-Phaeocystis_antarctica.AAC.4